MYNAIASLPARTLLAEACQQVGRQVPRWTQGAGGNISIKDGANLWIKASGHRLDAVTPGHALAHLPLEPLRSHLAQIDSHAADAEMTYAAILAALSHPDYGRASMESGFHGLLPEAFVAHFHALSSVAMAHAMHQEPQRWQAFIDSSTFRAPARLAPVAPGLQLSMAVATLPPFEICLLSHHGVILHAKDAGVIGRWQAFEQAFCQAWQLDYLKVGGPAIQGAQVHPGPLRVLFPDTAVFMARLEAITQQVDDKDTETCCAAWGKLRQLLPQAKTADRDATELWQATQLLHRACPTLTDLPETIAAALNHMPTERWRKHLVQTHAS